MQATNLSPSTQIHRRDTRLVGIFLFILSESMFFIGLFWVWFYLRANSVSWPPAGISLPVATLPYFNTVVMAVSVLTMIYAVRGMLRDNQRALITGLVASIALGLLFASIQSVEFASLGFTPSTNAFGSSFFFLLLFHVLRVVAGVIFMTIMLIRVLMGQVNSQRSIGVRACAMYWYFIGIVWLFVFFNLYLHT